MPTPSPFFAVIKPAGYAQFPDLMEVTPLPGYMPGSPPPRPLPSPTPPGPVDPGYSPPWAQLPGVPGPGGPVDPGYSPPWAQVPDPNAPRPSHPIMLPGMPGFGQWPNVPTHPIFLPGMPGWPSTPPVNPNPPPEAGAPTDEVQVIYKYSVSAGLTGPYVVAPAPTPEAPPA